MPLNILAEKKTLTYGWVQCQEAQLPTEIKFIKYEKTLLLFQLMHTTIKIIQC